MEEEKKFWMEEENKNGNFCVKIYSKTKRVAKVLVITSFSSYLHAGILFFINSRKKLWATAAAAAAGKRRWNEMKMEEAIKNYHNQQQ
jgi:hypothetical protein